MILADGDTIQPRHLNLSFAQPLDRRSADRRGRTSICRARSPTRRAARRSKAERHKIEDALKEAGGNKGRAAELLQVSYKTLLAKLKEHGIE